MFFTTTLQTEAGHVKQPSFITDWLLKPHIFTLQQLWISCRFQFWTNMFNQSHINTLVLRESQVCSSCCGASEHVIRWCSVLWFLIKWISSFCFHSAQWNMFSKQKIRRAQPVQNKPQQTSMFQSDKDTTDCFTCGWSDSLCPVLVSTESNKFTFNNTKNIQQATTAPLNKTTHWHRHVE